MTDDKQRSFSSGDEAVNENKMLVSKNNVVDPEVPR
jgi:hypothetical protein